MPVGRELPLDRVNTAFFRLFAVAMTDSRGTDHCAKATKRSWNVAPYASTDAEQATYTDIVCHKWSDAKYYVRREDNCGIYLAKFIFSFRINSDYIPIDPVWCHIM